MADSNEELDDSLDSEIETVAIISLEERVKDLEYQVKFLFAIFIIQFFLSLWLNIYLP